MSIHDLAELLGVAGPEKAHYDTVAGFMLHSLGHIPQPGEEVVYEGYRLVVQEMEGRRISQVVIAPLFRGEESEHADRTQENCLSGKRLVEGELLGCAQGRLC